MSSSNQVEDPEYGETSPLQMKQVKEKKLCERKSISRCVVGIVLICCFVVVWYSLYGGVGGNSITASLHRKDPCASAKYGCCEIYSQCKIKPDHIDYEKRRIGPIEIISLDNLDSNCPPLETLINNYNQHYGNMTTDCGPYGCCPGLDIGCDKTIRQSFRIGNNEGTKDLLHENSKIVNMKIPKVDERGSNCDSKALLIYHLIDSYSWGYPDKNDDVLGTIVVVFIAALVLAWLLGFCD